MTFLVAAFVAVWLLVLIYVLYMTQRQRGLEQDLRSLEMRWLNVRDNPEKRKCSCRHSYVAILLLDVTFY